MEIWDQTAPRPLGQHEFEEIRVLAYRTFGLDLKSGKEQLVSARLRKLVERGGFRSYQEYYRNVLSDSTGVALAHMIDALATNHTSFLREADHFDFLRQNVVPSLRDRDRIEIWSAACSTGEEVWTLAFVLNEAVPAQKVHIAGTDISTKALVAAERAVYPADRCHGLPAAWLSRYFVRDRANGYAVCPGIRTQAEFRRINLVGGFSWPRPFPVIFCRNVMIYFDRPTQEKVIDRISEYLEPGGYLFIGHAESLTRISHSLEYVQPAIYRKAKRQEHKWSR
jgi:chemotaxis protein methyltransferase CheR